MELVEGTLKVSEKTEVDEHSNHNHSSKNMSALDLDLVTFTVKLVVADETEQTNLPGENPEHSVEVATLLFGGNFLFLDDFFNVRQVSYCIVALIQPPFDFLSLVIVFMACGFLTGIQFEFLIPDGFHVDIG